MPNDNYTINILPNAIKDFYNNSNDTISYSFKTKSRSDYGILNLKINDLKEYPVIVQLLDNKESVVREKKLNSIEDKIEALKQEGIDINRDNFKYMLKTVNQTKYSRIKNCWNHINFGIFSNHHY